eukprot:4331141-Ditylum_brightwellii.AAC.1
MESDPPVEETKEISEDKEEETEESEDLEIVPPLFAGELPAPIFAPIPPIIGEEEELEDPISPLMTTPAEKYWELIDIALHGQRKTFMQ